MSLWNRRFLDADAFGFGELTDSLLFCPFQFLSQILEPCSSISVATPFSIFMAPSRKKGSGRASATAARRRQWNIGDLVLAKVKGFPAWPATVSEPEKWGYSKDSKKVLVYFFGTKQIAFCNPADVEAFTEEKKQALLIKRQAKGSDYVRAVREIINSFEKSKKQNQVDGVFTGHKVRIANAEESDYIAVNNELNAQRDIPTGTHNLQLKTSCSVTGSSRRSLLVDSVTATKLNAMDDRETLCAEENDDFLATEEPPLSSTYSSRKGIRGGHPKNVVIPKQALDDSKSRNSSRVELCRIQGFTLPSSCSSKNSEVGAVNLLQDVDSPSCVANGGIEDSGSEIATVESDTRSYNESSTVEFDSQYGLDMVVEGLEENVGLSKNLGLLTKTAATKRKRNPQRKGVNCDAAACSATLGGEAFIDVQNQNSGNVSLVSEKLNKIYTEKDSDEHLPLLKRARVRMVQSSYVEENVNSSIQKEEKSTIEIPGSLCEQACTSVNCSVSALADGGAYAVKNVVDGLSSSKNCNPVIEPMVTLWNVMKNNSYSCQVDVESVLPPSKRLHRAMEAMSANAEEDASFLTEAPSAVEVIPNGYCASPMHICSNMTTECKSNNELGVQNAESVDNAAFKAGSSGSSPHSSPTDYKETAKSPGREVICDQLDLSCNPEGLNHQICKGLQSEAMNCSYSANPSVLFSGNVSTFGQVQSSPPSSPPEDQLDKLWHSNAKGNNDCSELSCNEAAKESKHFEELNILEHPVESPNDVSGAEKPIKVSPLCQVDLLLYRIEGCCGEDAKFQKPQPDEDTHADIMCKVVKDATHESRIKYINDSSPQSSLEVPASATVVRSNLSCSPAAYVDHSSVKEVSCIPVSPCSTGRLDSPAGRFHLSSDNGKALQNIGSSCPDSHKDDAKNFEPSDTQSSGTVGGLSNHVDAHATLKSFEVMLMTLARTKESIDHLTSIAIDCAMFGVAAEAVEILAHKMETESKLQRRVNLFFLVESIILRSEGLKGDVGGIYPSAVLSVLPHLLSAVAPPGNAGQGNRRLCLKVLRQWLERSIFPESIICHHMQELNSPSGSSSISSLSQCSSRANGAFHDPVREMEGILDEYGSNSSFQLPGFAMPQMLKDEDEESDSDGGKFEAVTPEHNLDIPKECETFPLSATEKHSHILVDVDGELEREDVAPSSEEMKYDASHLPFELHCPLSNAPPLPSDMPPSSPPLPTSPLPPSPLPASVFLSSSPPLPPSATQHPFTNYVDSNNYLDTHTVHLQQPMAQESSASRIVDHKILDSTHYHAREHKDLPRQKQTSDHPSSSSLRSFQACNSPKHSVNSYQSKGCLRKKAYHLPPPHLASSNHLSYVKRQMPPCRENKPLLYSNRHNFVQQMGRRYIYSDHHDRFKSTSFEISEGARFSASSFPDPISFDKGRGLLPYPFIEPPCESARIANQRWAFSSRGMKHTHFIPIGFPFKNPFPMARRAPKFWQQR